MSVALNKQLVAIHRNDPEWIIRLWFAIHGGDPAPELIPQAKLDDIAIQIVKAMTPYLPAAKAKAVQAAIR